MSATSPTRPLSGRWGVQPPPGQRTRRRQPIVPYCLACRMAFVENVQVANGERDDRAIRQEMERRVTAWLLTKGLT